MSTFLDSSVAFSSLFSRPEKLWVGSGLYDINAMAFYLQRYDFYNAFTLWPPEVRNDLRAGLKARNQGDLGLSERYLRRRVIHSIP